MGLLLLPRFLNTCRTCLVSRDHIERCEALPVLSERIVCPSFVADNTTVLHGM